MNLHNGFITGLIVYLAVAIGVFLILREFFCWYWKINKGLALLTEIRDLLAAQGSLAVSKPESSAPVKRDEILEEQLAKEQADKKKEKQLLERYGLGHQLSADEADFLNKRGMQPV